MTKAELIERIARSRNLPPDVTKKDIAVILGIAFEELAGYFAKAKVTRASSPKFTFPRFGTFTKKKRPARRGVNPRTLEPMQIDASCTVDFKASKELRDQMNGAVAKAPKASVPRSKKRPSVAAPTSHPPKVAPGGRRLTPRDEDAELDALIDDDNLFVELPATRLKRVRPPRGSVRAEDEGSSEAG